MKINMIISMAVAVLLSANLAWSQEGQAQAPQNENAIQKITSDTKRTRKKKVEMCSECGKPEPECDCPGHGKNEDKKSEQNSSAKGN